MNKDYKPHVSEFKKNEVEAIKRLFSEYPVAGIVNLEGLGADHLQKIRHELKNIMNLKISRKIFMEIALDELKNSKKGIDILKENLSGVPALLFTKEDPFKLYKTLEKSKADAPAKSGQKAPHDIVIPAGSTPFTPGPMIGELGQLGIKTEVKEGKINIREDKLLVKANEEIKPKVAELLSKLGIQPMKIGLNLVLTYQNGEILTKDILGVSEEEFVNNLKICHNEALGLALFIGYVTKDNAELFIKKAYIEAKHLMDIGKIEENLQVQEIEEKPKEDTKKEDQPQSSLADGSKQEVQVKQEQVKIIKRINEMAVESKSAIKEEQMREAERIVKEMQEKAVKIEKKDAGIRVKTETETDINKLINKLKDKKIKGEI